MKKFWKNPWTIGICTTLIGFLLTVLYDLLKGKHVFTTMLAVLSAIWNAIIAFLTFDIKVWWILAGIAILFLILLFLSKRADRKETPLCDKDASFLKYTKDTIHGWSWEWEWHKNYEGKYDVEGLRIVCKYCGTPLVSEFGSYGLPYCMRCRRSFDEVVPDYKNVKVLILDTASRGLFTNNDGLDV